MANDGFLIKGQLISNRYEIIGTIGEGGMSVVYLANDIKLDRHVSLKVLRHELFGEDSANREDYERRLREEARAVAKLNHSNIVNVYDAGQDGDVSYIVVEYVDGTTLKEAINESSPFEDKQIVGVSLQIAAALSHAHKSGIIHRDIKPQNVLMTETGNIKVTDFGIARVALDADGSAPAVAETTLGSVHYISPEQARNEALDTRSDLYSLGIVMFEMATGRLPFDGELSVDVARSHVTEPLPDIREFNPSISVTLEAIIRKLTAKDKNERYRSADELQRDLRLSAEKRGDEIDAEDEGGEEEDTDVGGRGKKKGGDVGLMIGAFALSLFIIIAVVAFSWPWIQRMLDVGETNQPTATPIVVSVPKLTGMQLADATAVCEGLGLKLEVADSVPSDVTAADTIIDQDYEPGGYVAPGSVIGVRISVGIDKFPVANYVGDTVDNAYSRGEGSLFTLKVAEEYNDYAARGYVISQDPSAGSMCPEGTVITLVVSLGKENTLSEVPRLAGLTVDKAMAALESVGLRLGTTIYEPSVLIESGVIISQAVAEGQRAPAGTMVGVVISSGLPIATEQPPVTQPPSDSTQPTRTPGASSPPNPNGGEPTGEPTTEPSETAEPDETGGDDGTPIEIGEPTEPPTETESPTPVYAEKTITVYLTVDAAGLGEDVRVRITGRRAGGESFEAYVAVLPVGSFPLSVPLYDTGTVMYEITLNGIVSDTIAVDFN